MASLFLAALPARSARPIITAPMPTVPAGEKLGIENYEQLLRVALRFKLGKVAEMMLANKGSLLN